MPSIADVASQILRADAPVLLLDTCSIIDVIRAIFPRGPRCLQQASNVLAMATATPPACQLVVASIVSLECQEHIPGVTKELEKHLATMEEQSSLLHDACALVGIGVSFGRARYSALGLEDKLSDLSRRLLAVAVSLEQDGDASNRAFRRAAMKRPPAREGSQAKDCVILEEYLALCEHLKNGGFTKKRVFITSNINDYCEKGVGLHSTLKPDFAAAALTFTTKWDWALHELTH